MTQGLATPALEQPAPAEKTGRGNWVAYWLVLGCVAAVVSTGFVLASGGKRGCFLVQLATVVCLVAGFTDSRTGRIPNRLTYPAILLGLIVNGIMLPVLQALHAGTVVTWLGVPGSAQDLFGGNAAVSSLAGFAVCVVMGLLGAVVGGVHGGDLKLMAALGAMLGFVGVVDVLTISIGLALIYSLINLAFAGRLVKAMRLATNRMLEWHVLRQFQTPLPDAEPYSAMYFPMAVPLAVGMILWQYGTWHAGGSM